jgi:hypothetical protein
MAPTRNNLKNNNATLVSVYYLEILLLSCRSGQCCGSGKMFVFGPYPDPIL